jgi:molybdopterin-guanine dinucleotide biosynthesis protein A
MIWYTSFLVVLQKFSSCTLGRKFESLHAVYSTKLIPVIEKAFVRGKRSVLSSVFEMQDVVFVEVS